LYTICESVAKEGRIAFDVACTNVMNGLNLVRLPWQGV